MERFPKYLSEPPRLPPRLPPRPPPRLPPRLPPRPLPLAIRAPIIPPLMAATLRIANPARAPPPIVRAGRINVA
uniref:Uncharacterized protein n=1 Tax=Lepeophtheirus salmonis TaxID=72036 RepID=A0A0K2TJX5_LEPSM